MAMTVLKEKHNPFIPLLAVLTAVVLLSAFSMSPLAMAEEPVVSLTYDNGKYVLDWSRFSPTDNLDGYVIEVNGAKTYLDGYFLTYFDLSPLLSTPNLYKISLYANSKGVLTHIGTIVEKVVATLGQVKNMRVAGIDLTWDAVKNAKGYHVFVNGVYFGFSSTTSLRLFNGFTPSGKYQIAVLPVGKTIYYLSPQPTFYTHNVKAKMTLDLPIFIFEYMGQITVSWQDVDGVTFSYSIDGGDAITSTQTFVTLDVEDGQHSFELFGEDDTATYDFGTVTFIVEDEEVDYV
jgi:hypothetical protein